MAVIPKPAHGWTRLGQAVHGHTHDHLPDGTAYQRFNKRAALLITSNVGTMTCCWLFCALALCSLPSILSAFAVFNGVFPGWMVKASIIALVAWVAQTFFQLILLPALMVGQNLQNEAADARAAKTFEDVEFVMNQVNEHTDGGLKAVLDKLEEINTKLGGAA